MGVETEMRKIYPKIGASFSHPHLKYLKIDLETGLREFKKLGFKWMRVGCYWRDIEKAEGEFDFGEVDKIVNFCERNNINIILTLGMKAPRYPEFYFPHWLQEKTRFLGIIGVKDKIILDSILVFLTCVAKRYRNYNSIKMWQVENEPLDPSGEKHVRISKEFLEREVLTVRKLDPGRKILINVWGNALVRRKVYGEVAILADIVGLDIYMKVPTIRFGMLKRYSGPPSVDKLKSITEDLKSLGKGVIVTELQAEPWELEETIMSDKEFESFRPSDFDRNINYIRQIEPELILLWGFEYWLVKKENGDDSYVKEVEALGKRFWR